MFKQKKAAEGWTVTQAIVAIMFIIALSGVVLFLIKGPQALLKLADKASTIADQEDQKRAEGIDKRLENANNNFKLGTKEGYEQSVESYNTYLDQVSNLLSSARTPEERTKILNNKRDALFNIAQAYEHLGEAQYGKAMQSYDQIIKDFPDDIKTAEALFNLAALYRKSVNNQAANDVLEYLTNHPNKDVAAKAAFKLGEYYTRIEISGVERDFTKAYEHFAKALSITEGDALNYENLVNMIITNAELGSADSSASDQVYNKDAARYIIILSGSPAHTGTVTELLTKYPYLDKYK